MVRVIQDRRKDTGCQYTDRIEVALVTDSEELRAAIKEFNKHIAQETLAVSIFDRPLPGVEPARINVSGNEVIVYLRVVNA